MREKKVLQQKIWFLKCTLTTTEELGTTVLLLNAELAIESEVTVAVGALDTLDV